MLTAPMSVIMVDILQESVKISLWKAEVAELADALRSGRSELTLVRVQIPPSAPQKPAETLRVFSCPCLKNKVRLI